jgi:hypothetical protein
MRSASTLRLLAASGTTLIVLGLSGCGWDLDATYGKSRGTSLNGTAVLTRMLRDSGHEVRTAIRLNDELAEWAEGIVRFAPYPGPPARDEAVWYRNWLANGPDRWLIYVVRDFDTVAEYWQNVQDDLTDASEASRRAEAERMRSAAADYWVAKLPEKAKSPADLVEWFGADSAWMPPRVCTKLSGPWAAGIDAAAAGLTVHEPLKTARGSILLVADGKAIVVETVIGQGHVLVIANGSFLLNEAVVNPARRPLAELVIQWSAREAKQVAVVEGAFVLGGEAATPTIWDLLLRIPSLRWVAIHVGLAALLASLARAPRLGRPRPDPPSGADRPAEHALALGALLARAKAAPEARELLDRYRHWRFPRTSRPVETRAHLEGEGVRIRQDEAAASPTQT